MALVLLGAGCNLGPAMQGGIRPEGAPRYSLVYVIHGDGDYLYHDEDGVDHRADLDALTGARAVAEQNPRAEVFIFHEQRRRRVLGLLSPQRDGRFYYYRGGRLEAKESYWRDAGETRFDPVLERYERFRAMGEAAPMRLFLYFGHEVPEVDGTGYDASYAGQSFTARDLADGMARLTGPSSRFDLAVLSTCYGGSPFTIGTLEPVARFVIASPENLHLSHFDQGPLERLDVAPEEIPDFARAFARLTFDRLASDIQTVVSVAVYDTDRVREFVTTIAPRYREALTAAAAPAAARRDRVDCADEPDFARPGMGQGIHVSFRPSRFGRQKLKRVHSGWVCPAPARQDSPEHLSILFSQ